MRAKLALRIGFVLAALAMPSPVHPEKLIPIAINQTWKIILEKIEPEHPCEAAELDLRLTDSRKRKVATLRMPIPETAGRVNRDWPVTFQTPGDHRLRASITGCGKGSSGKMNFPVYVHPISQERFIHIQVVTGPDGYHLSHLNVNRERPGEGLFEVEFSPTLIRNLTGRELVPCRRTQHAHLEYFAQMGPEWRPRGDFMVEEGITILEPDQWTPMELKVSYMIMNFGGPGAVREVVRINYREAHSTLYPEDPENFEEQKALPRFCDAYFVEIWGPESPPEDSP